MKKVMVLVVALVLIFSLSVVAFAADSPVAKPTVVVTVVNGPEAKPENNTVKKGEEFTFVADDKQGEFNSWSVYKKDGSVAKEGTDYNIVSGKLTDETIKLEILSDIVVCGNYNGTKTAINGGIKDDKAPQTGDFTAIYVSAFMMVALFGAFVAKKQLSK